MTGPLDQPIVLASGNPKKLAEMREINGITYMNDGDWVESCSALVEHHDGRWELLHFQPHAVKADEPVAKEARIRAVA